MSPASTASGWGSVKGNSSAAGTRQLTSLTERSGVAAAVASGGPVGAGGGAKDKGGGGSSAGGSTFADARERERVIATLQNSQDVSALREKKKVLFVSGRIKKMIYTSKYIYVLYGTLGVVYGCVFKQRAPGTCTTGVDAIRLLFDCLFTSVKGLSVLCVFGVCWCVLVRVRAFFTFFSVAFFCAGFVF